jgi:hypothetical protein
MKTNTVRDLNRRWLELEASGISLEPPKFRKGITLVRPAKGLLIRQEGDDCSNAIFIFEDGRVGFILTAFIRRDLPGGLIIRDTWLEVPWFDRPVDLLPDPADDGPKNARYVLAREDWEFPRKEVLNHRLKGKLFRGDIRCGMLLAKGGIRPPKEYRGGARIRVHLKIRDQWDQIHSEPFELLLMNLFEGRAELTRKPREPLYPPSENVDSPDDETDSLSSGHNEQVQGSIGKNAGDELERGRSIESLKNRSPKSLMRPVP